ncbi:unnamed protein product [Tuber melanosporum]|uniref:(Perigord truffle) hypothetical protein n=1 Tax=Tuber melanosporum (strain Mel28) TaxID=656061 RepID=D5GKG3_TUBMM|nr:uncharacterized protein GSTUM_00009531001 [Tuber melanosporum]CAZ85006.1 unnamed protein product [Tuber melanosporum]
MLKSIILLSLTIYMGNAHPDDKQADITRVLVRQNAATTTAFRPPLTSTLNGGCQINGWARCGNVCYDIQNGATCCNASASYRCIPGTYCLFNGLCCPNELDPETCARNSGLQIPAGFSRPTRFPSATRTSSVSRSSSSSASNPSSSNTNRSLSPNADRSSSSNERKTLSNRPSTKRPEPTSFPTVDEDSVAPKEAAPVTTTHGSITATISNNPVTLAYTGEVLPLQTVANHKPAPSSYKAAVLAALAKDPQTKPFGDLLSQAPAVFEGLEEKKEYYIFAPTAQFVLEFLKYLQDDPRRLARRKVLVDPNTSQQFAEKPKGAPDIKRVPSTLKTTLVGETKYVDLGAGEGARVVSNPVTSENGTVHIISGFGNSTLVHAEEIPFEGGVIKKCDGFFTLPHALETAFADTQGRLWSTALQNANLLKELSEKRMVTIFAVQDSNLDQANLPASADLNRMVHDGLSYEPDMSDGLCLQTRGEGSLRVTRKGNDILVNGVRITKANVIAKNGVIHYLEKIPPVEKCTGSAGEPGVKKSAGSITAISKATVLGLSVASLVVYAWI